MAERTSDRWVSIVLSVLLPRHVGCGPGVWILTYQQVATPTPTLAIEGTVVDSRTVNAAALKTPPAPQPPAPEPTARHRHRRPLSRSSLTGPPDPTPEELAQREQAVKEQAEKEQAQKDQAVKEQAEREQAEKDQAEAQDKQTPARRAETAGAAPGRGEAQTARGAGKGRCGPQGREAKRLADQKRAEAAQRAADDKARAESEAELRNSLAAEEHANQCARAVRWRAGLRRSAPGFIAPGCSRLRPRRDCFACCW